MDIFSEGSIWLVYLILFIGPFVQEDTAVIGAASLSVARPEDRVFIFLAILAGLITSDSWKYWLGWAAKHHVWARKFAERDGVVAMRDRVKSHAAKTLIAVRFLPMVRIPTYLACGFFGVRYIRYWLSIAFSAFLYISMFFLVFNLLGEIAGERLKTFLPFIAIGLVLTLFAVLFFLKRIKRGKTL